MRVRVSDLAAGAGFVLGAGVAAYEIRWVGRSGLAWLLIALGVAIALVALGQFLAQR